ncbi:MAG: hypothetical protein JRI35_08435 [Deltaproteobacteria bacterium]|nr:hypothetical protein [Deltaproteobacteria bacterium]
MPAKIPIHPRRIRQVPKQFSWVDGRLVRDRHLDKCSHPAAALYLFLITVSDAQGLSYYSDQSIGQRLNMDSCTLAQARLELVQHELIAYKKPLYQVLDLAPPELAVPVTRNQSVDLPQSIGQVFRQIMEGGS